MKHFSSRLEVIDFVKGIAIVLVVWGHCLRGLFDKGVINDLIYHYLDYSIYTFHMPVFFIISGLFFSASIAKGARRFWDGKVKSIVYPYFVWSFIQGVIQIVLSLNTNVLNHSFHSEQLLSILWKPISPFWFLYALFFCNLICYFLINKVGLLKLAVLTISFFIVSTLLSFKTLGDIAYGMLYFLLGIYLTRINFISYPIASVRLIIFLFFTFLVTSFIGHLFDFSPRLMFVNALIGAYGLYNFSQLIVDKFSNNRITKHIEMLGQYSMSIFVMHILALGFARTVLMEKFSVNDYLALILIEMFFAIYLPVFVQDLALKIGVNNLMGLPFSAKR